MLTAFVKHADGATGVLDTVEAVAEAWSRSGSQLWVDLDTPTPEEVRSIGELFHFEHEALDDCLMGEQRPRIDEFENYLFLVLYGALGEERTDRFDPHKLAAFLSDRLLVTVHRDPLLSIRSTRDKCRKQTAQMLGKGVDFILYTIIDAVVDRYVNIADAYEQQLDDLEEASLGHPGDASILAELAVLRRELVELKHIAVSQLELLAPIARGEFDYISETLEPRFRHVRDHLRTVVDEVEYQRELLRAIRENYNTAVANRTNEAMKILTIMASIFIPLTFLAGIYGMNFQHMPELRWAWAYPLLLLIMAAMAGTMLHYFRRRGWIGTRRNDKRKSDED